MSELTELETRLNAALERLEYRVATLGDDRGEIADLTAALGVATDANAAFEVTLTAQQETLATLDAQVQHLRAVNAQLHANNRALREACETGQVDAALINDAMRGELDSLQAQRSLDQAEAAAAMATLDALVQSAREDA